MNENTDTPYSMFFLVNKLYVTKPCFYMPVDYLQMHIEYFMYSLIASNKFLKKIHLLP